MKPILVYAKFLGIWLIGIVLARWWGTRVDDMAVFVGLFFAVCWYIWIQLKSGETIFRDQLRELYSYIADSSELPRTKQSNLEASAVHHAILDGYLKKGMTVDEINGALRKWGEKNEYSWIPSVEPLADPKRLVPRRVGRKKAAIFSQHWFGYPSPELWLEFLDDKLTGWKIKNCDGLPEGLITPYAKLYQAAKKNEAQRLSNPIGFTNPVDPLSRQALHPAKDDEQP